MAKNISEDSVDVFTWRRHGQRADGDYAGHVHQIVENGILKNFLLSHNNNLTNKIILDMGCGGGDKTCALAMSSEAKLVIGIDGSQSAIEASRKLKENLGLKNAIFFQGFMEDAPIILKKELQIEKVDFIFNSFNLHHVEDYPKILSIFSNLLHPGGFLFTIFTTIDRGLASFVIKNRIAYALGKTKESRMAIGKFLFSWFDNKHNKVKENFDWENFYADRYSAFYRFMRPGQVIRYLRETGFELVESKPPIRAYDFLYRRYNNPKAKVLLKYIARFPLGEFILSFFYMVFIFFRKGDSRSFLCIKTSRKNIRSID